MLNEDYTPCLKVYTSKIINFARYNKINKKTPPATTFKRPNFKPTPQTLSRMRTYIDFLVDTAEVKRIHSTVYDKDFNYKLGFLTLTLPFEQVTERGRFIERNFCKNKFCHHYWGSVPGALKYDDKQIKHDLLNQFLTEIRDRFDISVYMWKAESQENGRIHFHIIINKFVYWVFLRNMWNRICSKLEPLPACKKSNMPHILNPDNDPDITAYNKAIDKAEGTPNSIDIHSIKHIGNLKKYFTKYMTKHSEDRRSIQGKIWGTSEYVSNYKGILIELNGLKGLEFRDYFSKFHKRAYTSFFFNVYKITLNDIEKEFPKSFIAKEIREKMLGLYNISTKEVLFMNN